MHEIAEFLRNHPPFDTLEPDELAAVAAACEIEYAEAGTILLEQSVETPGVAWVVRRGAVELLDNDRVVDVLGEGEMFGHASLLSEWPTALAVRASEDSLLYRLPAEAVRPVLARPVALRFAARSLAGRYEMRQRELDPLAVAVVDPARRPVSQLIRRRPVVAQPGDSVRDAARRMVDASSSAVLVDLGDRLGIVTDRDLRERVVAAGVPPDTPLSQVMSAPAQTIGAAVTGAEALLDMLDRGIRHLPVLDSAGGVVGVISDTDLMAVETRTPFHLRRAIAAATTVDELAAAVSSLPETVVGLHDAKVAAVSISRVIATVYDALTRRAIELVISRYPDVAPFAWLTLGSVARHEAFPSSDQDSAIAWRGEGDDPAVREPLSRLAAEVVGALERCGIPGCPQGAVAAKPLFLRSEGAWRAAARSWLDDPNQEKALILVSVVADGRAVWTPEPGWKTIEDAFADARRHPQLLRRLGLFALSQRPPTGFFRDFVVAHDGERKGTLDIKQGGLLPVVDIARWAAMTSGVTEPSTPGRIAAAEQVGTLDRRTASTLQVAFELFTDLRMEHQIDALRRGVEPDNAIDPRALAPLTRRYLKDAFRAVADVQRGLAGEFDLAAL
jgi:CBS domain-containing protein